MQSFDGDLLQTVRGQQQFGESPLPKMRSTSRIRRTLDRGVENTEQPALRTVSDHLGEFRQGPSGNPEDQL